MKRLSLWLALPLAALSGFALQGAFAPTDFWPLSFIGFFLLLWALMGRTFWSAFLIGFVSGATFWLTLINWLTLYLGPVPWLALGTLQAILFGIGAALISLVVNRGPLRWPSIWGRILVVSLVIAALWTLRESVTSVWPYGGFSWGKLAHSQAASPISHDVAWVGTSGLSFLVALTSTLLFQVLRERKKNLLIVPILFFVALIAMPPVPIDVSGTTNVLAVQGNSRAGLFDHGLPGEILQDHVSGTLPYSGEEIDIVVWPENASDINPLDSQLAAMTLTTLSKKIGAPIVTGAITSTSRGEFFNSSLVWGNGLLGQYDKIHPVPFAEYMPNRQFWRTFQPDLVDLVTRDYAFGTRSNVIDVSSVLVGISICFDITDDQQIYDMVADGAQVIFAQTNNADFGKTSENLQQLAIARLRAIETGRSVVNISTVGTSEIISPTGATLDSIPAYQPGEMLDAVPLSSTITPAMGFGRFIEWLIGAFAVVGLMLILVHRKP